jgi:hypothetical protein
MNSDVGVPIDEATSRFLKTAGADLQRRLGKLGTVEGLNIDDRSAGVTLETHVRVGSRILDFRASGDNLVAAYAARTHGIASHNPNESSPTNP